MSPQNINRSGLALLLGSLAALTPLAIDAYLPALPSIATYFGVGIQLVEASISTFFFGYATGQLIAAPFSDRLGRRPLVLFGLALFAVASVLIVLCTSVEQLLVLRFLQAFGGGCAAVNTPAIVRDLFDEQESASMFALIALIMMIAPLLAPAIGAALLWLFEWRMIFVALLIYAVFVMVVLHRRLPETGMRQADTDAPPVRNSALRNYLQVFQNRPALGFMLSSSFAAGCLFVFLTDAAFAYMDYFGVSSAVFPLLFGANVIALIAATRLNLHLLRGSGPRRMIRLGLVVQVLATFALAVYVSVFQPRLLVFVPLVMISIGANGLIVSNSMASFLSYFGTGSGAATALFSTASFTVGGTLGALLGLVHDGTLRTLALGMFTSAVCGLLVNLALTRPVRQTGRHQVDRET